MVTASVGDLVAHVLRHEQSRCFFLFSSALRQASLYLTGFLRCQRPRRVSAVLPANGSGCWPPARPDPGIRRTFTKEKGSQIELGLNCPAARMEGVLARPCGRIPISGFMECPT